MTPMEPAAPPDPDAALEMKIADVYRVFACPKPEVIEGCPCCVERREVDVLLATPLRELGIKPLGRYMVSVFLTVGGQQDFKYLLPRILDLAIYKAEEAPDAELVLNKLAHANWRSWPFAQQQAVEGLIGLWFERAVRRHVEQADGYLTDEQAGRVLCGAAIAGLPLQPLLDVLKRPFAAPVLADLLDRSPDQLSPFWEDAPEGLKELLAFLDGA